MQAPKVRAVRGKRVLKVISVQAPNASDNRIMHVLKFSRVLKINSVIQIKLEDSPQCHNKC
jgi:hypothetical protein